MFRRVRSGAAASAVFWLKGLSGWAPLKRAVPLLSPYRYHTNDGIPCAGPQDSRNVTGPRSAVAADDFVEQLVQLGVSTFFVIPGGSIARLLVSLTSRQDITVVQSRFESSAVLEARGYWLATGKIPCVVVTSGPGATNLFTGVADASLNCVPMILISGDVAWGSTGNRLVQCMGKEFTWIEGCFAPITNDVFTIPLGKPVANFAQRAFLSATNPTKRGPSLVLFPSDVQRMSVPQMEIVSPMMTSETEDLGELLSVGVAAERVADLLIGAERPLLYIGNAARHENRELLQLVEKYGLPYATTPAGKGALSETHTLSLRNGGMAGSNWARAYIAEHSPDVVLALGTDLDDTACGQMKFPATATVIHIDRNPSVFGRNNHVTVAICANFSLVIRALLRNPKANGNQRLKDHIAQTQTRVAELKSRVSPCAEQQLLSSDAVPIVQPRAISALQTGISQHFKDVCYFSDIGEHMLFLLHYFTAVKPNSFHISLSPGAMGSGITQAIGYAIGKPNELVVCICGDGGMQMVGGELILAKMMELNILFVVMNDARYNMVYHGMKDAFGCDAQWATPQINFQLFAHSMGITSERIRDPKQLTPEFLGRFCSTKGPKLLDVLHDPSTHQKGAGRVESLMRMSQSGTH